MALSNDLQERDGVLRFQMAIGCERVVAYISRAECQEGEEGRTVPCAWPNCSGTADPRSTKSCSARSGQVPTSR